MHKECWLVKLSEPGRCTSQPLQRQDCVALNMTEALAQIHEGKTFQAGNYRQQRARLGKGERLAPGNKPDGLAI